VNTIDFDKPPPDHSFKISLEREETRAERGVRLFKDLALFVCALAFVAIIAGLCVATLVSPTAQADEKKWAMSVLAATAGGVIGYLVKK
jgi:hypothetical protein